jgi:hypothetical protein
VTWTSCVGSANDTPMLTAGEMSHQQLRDERRRFVDTW